MKNKTAVFLYVTLAGQLSGWGQNLLHLERVFETGFYFSDFIDTACLRPTSTLKAVSGDMFHVVLLFCRSHLYVLLN